MLEFYVYIYCKYMIVMNDNYIIENYYDSFVLQLKICIFCKKNVT